MSNNELSKLSKNSIFVGSRIVYASQSADNKTYKVAFANIGNYPLINEQKLAVDDVTLFQNYIILSTIFLVFLVVFLVAFFKNRGVFYSLSDVSLFNEKGLLP